jgi:hypothetical protein
VASESPAEVSNAPVALSTLPVLDLTTLRTGHLHSRRQELGLPDRASLASSVGEFLADAQIGLALFADGHSAEQPSGSPRPRLCMPATSPRRTRTERGRPTREEARSTYASVARALAIGRHADSDLAARYLLRILERDSCRRHAHLSLVSCWVGRSARRSGRAYRLYVRGWRRSASRPAVPGAVEAESHTSSSDGAPRLRSRSSPRSRTPDRPTTERTGPGRILDPLPFSPAHAARECPAREPESSPSARAASEMRHRAGGAVAETGAL